MSVLFADIQGFSAYAERNDPQEVQLILSKHLSVMTDVLKHHGGTLDKYMGDGILAFFGDADPDDEDMEAHVGLHAAAAVRAGLEMKSAMDGLNGLWESQGRTGHALRIGINTGFVSLAGCGKTPFFTSSVAFAAVAYVWTFS